MKVYLDNCAFNRPFDYTEWRKDLYKDVSLDDFCRNVKKFKETMPKAKGRKAKGFNLGRKKRS